MAEPPAEKRLEALARHLEALASPTRLELLHLLRTPRPLHEIRVAPSLSRNEENPERPLSRQAVTRHLHNLMDLGLVSRLASDPRARSESFVLNHERLFAIVDEIRTLAKLRPVLGAPAPPGSTVARDVAPLRLPDPPRLLMAYGRDDGVAFALGPEAGPWRIGRAPACEVRLDYDPYVSAENSVIERSGTAYSVRDAPRSRNGTWVNWRRLPPGGQGTLRSGDVLTIGRSVLVIQL